MMRLSLLLHDFNPNRLEAIKVAITSHFPNCHGDDWWFKHYARDGVLFAEVDARHFGEEETEFDNEEVEWHWMDRVAWSIWEANGGWCPVDGEVNFIPHEVWHWSEPEDYERVADGSATIPDFLTRTGKQTTGTQEVIRIVKKQSEDDRQWRRSDCDEREAWVASTPADTDMCVVHSPLGWLYLVRLGGDAATRQEAQEEAEKLAKEIEQMRAAE
jgi:hypothetical protein